MSARLNTWEIIRARVLNNAAELQLLQSSTALKPVPAPEPVTKNTVIALPDRQVEVSNAPEKSLIKEIEGLPGPLITPAQSELTEEPSGIVLKDISTIELIKADSLSENMPEALLSEVATSSSKAFTVADTVPVQPVATPLTAAPLICTRSANPPLRPAPAPKVDAVPVEEEPADAAYLAREDEHRITGARAFSMMFGGTYADALDVAEKLASKTPKRAYTMEAQPHSYHERGSRRADMYAGRPPSPALLASIEAFKKTAAEKAALTGDEEAQEELEDLLEKLDWHREKFGHEPDIMSSDPMWIKDFDGRFIQSTERGDNWKNVNFRFHRHPLGAHHEVRSLHSILNPPLTAALLCEILVTHRDIEGAFSAADLKPSDGKVWRKTSSGAAYRCAFDWADLHMKLKSSKDPDLRGLSLDLFMAGDIFAAYCRERGLEKHFPEIKPQQSAPAPCQVLESAFRKIASPADDMSLYANDKFIMATLKRIDWYREKFGSDPGLKDSEPIWLKLVDGSFVQSTIYGDNWRNIKDKLNHRRLGSDEKRVTLSNLLKPVFTPGLLCEILATHWEVEKCYPPPVIEDIKTPVWRRTTNGTPYQCSFSWYSFYRYLQRNGDDPQFNATTFNRFLIGPVYGDYCRERGLEDYIPHVRTTPSRRPRGDAQPAP